MTVETKVQAVLVADAGVIALTTTKRIKIGFVGQALNRPYISHFPASQNEEARTSEGVNNFRAWPFYQVSCFGDSYEDAATLAVAVIDATKNLRSDTFQVIGAVRSTLPYDDETKIHHVAVELNIAESL